MVLRLIKPTSFPYRFQPTRTFVNAKIKWVRDPYLDQVVSKEKNLIPILSLKALILTSPTKTLPINHPSLKLPSSFIQKYPTLFLQFQPCPFSLPQIKLTQKAFILHKEELAVHEGDREKAVERLAKVLMLAGGNKLPFKIIELLRFDLGLPDNYVIATLSYYPDWFQVCRLILDNGVEELGLELVSWREDLSVSAMVKREEMSWGGYRKGMRLRFPMRLPDGFDLEKKVHNWVEGWQDLPYVSPYENAFHLGMYSDQAEKWTVAVLHELLHLLVSKKTEIGNLVSWGEWMGFGALRLRRALKHHPGIFYISNKIRMQTVVLRESYRKDFLVDKHPLMGMRYRYIHLIHKSEKRRRRQGGVLVLDQKKKVCLDGKVAKGNDTNGEEEILDTSSDSESEDVSDEEMVTGV